MNKHPQTPPKPKGAEILPRPKVSAENERKEKLIKSFLILAGSGLLLMVFIVAFVFWKFSSGLPKIITVEDYKPLGVTRVLGNNGSEDALMGEFYKERRYLVPYDKIPQVVVKAFISAEDDKFFEHSGFNITSIIRAGIANFRAGHVVQGGSTITQQVAKSLLLTPEKSFGRKIKELVLSGRIEKNLTKQQILYLYLNQIYLGHGAYGVQAASRIYYRKNLADITLAEAALLAGMPQAPSKYSPLLNPKRAKERQLYVLRRMFENKHITQLEMSDAAALPLKVFHEEEINDKYSRFLIESIRKYLTEKYGEKAVIYDGLNVSIPSSPELARAARKSLQDGLRAVDKRIGYRGVEENLDTPEKTEEFLKRTRVELVEEKLHHQVLMPDGKLDPFEALRMAGLTNESQLLDVGEIYEGVVTAIDNKKKTTSVFVGALKGELPMEKMRWAHGVRDEKNPQMSQAEPVFPSQVLKKGDVISVRVLANDLKGIVFGLEQKPAVQGAIYSLEAQTGYVLAMEGGSDFVESEFNRAMQSQRQPGSSFKPLIYAAALEKGYTPASILADSPIVYEDAESGKWKPSNFEEKFYGDTTFRQALIKSRNVPTIKIVQSLSVPFVIDYAKRLGLNGQFNQDLSISLGSASVSLSEMTKAYALFPRLGRKVTPILISKVVDREGKVLEENAPIPLPAEPKIAKLDPVNSPTGSALPSPSVLNPNDVRNRIFIPMPKYPPPDDADQVMDPRVAYVMTHLMKEVVTYGTGHEATNLGRSAAGKTGTTNDYIDAWFMGFTPFVVTGVWVGFDNQKSIGHLETGAKAALPIWLSFMKEAVKKYPDTDFLTPRGVTFASIDPSSGKLVAPNSSNAIKEAFIEGTQPTASDSTTINPETSTEFFKEDTD